MANREGFPIWYELLSNDVKASASFYERIFGWKVNAAQMGGNHDYRILETGHDPAGGVMQLNDEMRSHGARPTWFVYFGVEHVDAAVKRATELGAKVLMPAFDIPDVGRIAMLADPQGAPFYVMRGASNQDSKAYERTGMGKCNWNELTTGDQEAANEFYAKLFGWSYPTKMPMPEGTYAMIDVGGTHIGGTMPRQAPDRPTAWSFYFRAADIDAAVAAVKEGGGTVHVGPNDVPGGDVVIFAIDPQGAGFGVAASKKEP